MGSGRRKGLTSDCIRAGFVNGDGWGGSLVMGNLDVDTINDGYRFDGVDACRPCSLVDRHICAC
jgi:hypothetical protein